MNTRREGGEDVRKLKLFERLAWGIGIVLLAFYGAVRVHGEWMKRHELRRFDEARQQTRQFAQGVRPTEQIASLPERLPVDDSLWSESRIRAYEATLNRKASAPLAVLRIPKLDLRVPVLDGTDELTLNRAVGRIPGTALPGEPGNIGIAGHRDGFFRGLKDVAPGDRIELLTLDGADRYVVEQITIVDPAAVEVLGPTAEPSITLVTCYPFYFVGSAPQRYVVRAVRSDSAAGA